MSFATLTTFCFYLAAVLLIGGFAYRSTENLDDYLLGGRRLGPAVTALSAGASDMSGWLLLGLPGALYVSGLIEAWIVIGLLLGALANWVLVARPLRIQTQQLSALTLPDFFEARFEDRSHLLRLVSALIVLTFFTFYVASGLVAGATLFAATFGLSYFHSLLLGVAVVVGYTAVGGFLAVSWTDFLQGMLMLFGLVAVPVFMMMEVGGVGETVDAVRAVSPDYLSMLSGATVLGVLSLMAWGLGYFGQPHILARFMAIRNPAETARAGWIAMIWMLVSSVGAIGVGVVGIGYMSAVGHPLDPADSESVFIEATQALFNPWIAGILLAAILAAVMSTIDSQLLVSSSALSEDFYKHWLQPDATDRELVIVGRLTVLLIAMIATMIAIDPDSRVLGLVSYAWAGLGASFGPVVLMSLYDRKMTRNGALAGMLVGAVTVIVWKQMTGGLFDVYELLPAFVFSVGAIAVTSRLRF